MKSWAKNLANRVLQFYLMGVTSCFSQDYFFRNQNESYPWANDPRYEEVVDEEEREDKAEREFKKYGRSLFEKITFVEWAREKTERIIRRHATIKIGEESSKRKPYFIMNPVEVRFANPTHIEADLSLDINKASFTLTSPRTFFGFSPLFEAELDYNIDLGKVSAKPEYEVGVWLRKEW